MATVFGHIAASPPPGYLAPVARHMTEFTGLDIEMTFKDHYHEASGAKG